MKRSMLLGLVVLASCVFARQTVEKVSVQDTLVSKRDTVVQTLTLQITSTWQDTSILVKKDTLVLKPVRQKKPEVKK